MRRLSSIGVAWLIASTGCGESDELDADRFVRQTQVTVRPEVLDDYVGTYRLPSGALLRVSRDGDRLMAGVPPYELLPQTTREFTSNRNPAALVFDRNDEGQVHRLNFRLAQRDLWIERVDADDAVDPTIMVDAGGHRLRMLVTGSGRPAVVIEDGFGSCIETRAELQAELSRSTTVVSYDHAGTGGSEDGPLPRDAQTIASELRTSLENAGVEPPFVIVGASIGGDYMRVFAHENSNDVAGLVLLDPTPDWGALETWLNENAPRDARSFTRMQNLANRAVTKMMTYQEQGRQQEWAVIDATRLQAHEALPLSGYPVTQITGASRHQTVTMSWNKVRFFDDWLNEYLPDANHVLAENSGHAVFSAEPELVLREIRGIVEQARQQSQ